MKKNLIIIGAGGHGKVVADTAKIMNKWENIYFLDNDTTLCNVVGIDVIGQASDWYNYIDDNDIFVAIGDNTIRKKIISLLEENKANIATLIHPAAVIADKVTISYGSIVMAGTVINSSTEIGKGCIINTSSSIDHDNLIGEYVHISPGVHTAGNVSIGGLSWLGIGSTVSNNVKINEECIVGAGAVVVKDLTEPGIYLGVPARRVN